MTYLKYNENSPNVGDHVIICPEMGLHIPWSLWGIFSYFPMTKLKDDVLVDSPDMYMSTPTVCNPHTNVWEGNMSQERDQKNWFVLDDISDDQGMILSLAISREEHMAHKRKHQDYKCINKSHHLQFKFDESC